MSVEEINAFVEDDASLLYSTPEPDGSAGPTITVTAEEIRAHLAAINPTDIYEWPDGSISVGAPDSDVEVAPPPSRPNPDHDELRPAIADAISDGSFYDGVSLEGAVDHSVVSRPAIGPLGETWRVTPTNYFSPNSIGKLTFPGGHCTAYVYGTNVVVTAAHCLKPGNGNWVTGVVRFYRGLDGAGNYLQLCEGATYLAVSGGWSVHQGPENDWGMVKFSCQFPGTYGSGHMPIVWRPCPPPTRTTYMWLPGYGVSHPNELWEDYDLVAEDDCEWVGYALYSEDGLSGAPLIIQCAEFGHTECARGVNKGTPPLGFGRWGHSWVQSNMPGLISFRGY